METKTSIEIKLAAAKQLKSFFSNTILFFVVGVITSFLIAIGLSDGSEGMFIASLIGALVAFFLLIFALVSLVSLCRHIVNYYEYKLALNSKKTKSKDEPILKNESL